MKTKVKCTITHLVQAHGQSHDLGEGSDCSPGHAAVGKGPPEGLLRRFRTSSDKHWGVRGPSEEVSRTVGLELGRWGRREASLWRD